MNYQIHTRQEHIHIDIKKAPQLQGFSFIPSLYFSQREKTKEVKNYLASSAFGFSRKRIPRSRNWFVSTGAGA